MRGRPVVTVQVRAEPGVDLIRALRGWLKIGLRNFGLRCITIKQEDEMAYDLNEAEKQQGGTVPEGIYALEARIKPGGAGDDYLLRRSKNGALEMLQLELKVATGEHAGHTFSEFVALDFIEGRGWDQEQINRYKTAARIGRSKLRSLVESARSINPEDQGDAAKELRRLDSLQQINGFVFLGQVDVREQDGFRPKNSIGYIVTPGMPEWRAGVTSANGTAVVPLAKPNVFDDEIPF